jgi:pantetheine-phosphate adenylyltransferase
MFPGTFDPVTVGHLDIIRRAVKIFDEILVAVATHHSKRELFSIDERVEMMREVTATIGGVTVLPFTGLLIHFARAQGINTVVRGLRVFSDFEYEFQMALMNRKLYDAVETVFLMPSEEHVCLNSTVVKEIAMLGGPIEALVAPTVARRLHARLGEPKAR